MGTERSGQQSEAFDDAEIHDQAEPVQAWQQIANGRYMPRRIRGSFPGRELG
jgi:hypothetical protein